jgi:hypothetical protein
MQPELVLKELARMNDPLPRVGAYDLEGTVSYRERSLEEPLSSKASQLKLSFDGKNPNDPFGYVARISTTLVNGESVTSTFSLRRVDGGFRAFSELDDASGRTTFLTLEKGDEAWRVLFLTESRNDPDVRETFWGQLPK